MKNLPNVLWRLICIISISLFAFGKTLAQIAENPHRGMYVDKFATYNSSEYLNDLSILGVDKEHDGIFEKEEELLEYASKNHFTSLTLYDLEGIFSDNAPKVWNQTDKRFEDLEEHLCRFIHRARTVYLIDEIIASVGSKASADNVPTFGRGFNSATLPFEFTEDEMALPSYTPNLQQIAGQYSDNDPMFLRSEIGKLVLRIAHFTSCGNQLQFNGFSTEYEFWNQDDIAADDLSATTFEIFLNDLNNIKDNFVGSHPGSPFTINIYYGKSATSYSKLTCPGCVAEFIDGNATGVTATDCGLAAAKPNYCGLSNWRRADRIFFEKYLSKSNQFTSHHEEIIFSGNQTLTNTVIHPLFSAQSRFNGATNDFLGDWILGGVGTNASDNDFGQLRNIFQAEKIHFLDWQSSQSGATNPNIEEPGAFQWYTSSYMLKSFKNTPLFYYDYQACETTPVLTFKYSGPREKNITYSFSITVTPGSGGPTFNQTTGNTSGETPDFTTSQGEFLPSYNISGIVPNSKVTASLTLNFDNGISVTYDKEIDLSSASISAIGKDGSSFTICEGEDIVLQASISNYSTPSYQWQFSVNNSTFTDIPSEISQLFHITKTGYYKCKIRCSNGTYYDSNSIQFIIKENPYILISASCSNPMTLSANNTGINGYAPGTYSYLWSNGETTPSITINSANHLSSYNVIVTNLSNNCIASNLIKIPDTFPSSSNITVTTSNPNCGSGSVNITVNNLTTDDVVKAIISDGISNFYYDNWTNTSNSKTITGLPVGNYHFTINSNSYACSASTDFSIGSDFDVSFVSTETHTNATCKGGANGSVQVNLSYTAGLIFEWSGITPATLTINANNVIATGFKPGTYFLKITDNSCHYRYVSFTINSNVSVSIIPVVVNTDCSGLNGKITFPPTSGYTFNWDYQSSTSNEIFPLSPGIYNCIVSFSGCTQTFTRFVDKNPPINIETKCAQDGSTHLMVYGGTPGSVSAYQITSNPAATWSAVVGNIGEYTSNLSTPRTYTSIQVIDSYTPACTTSVSNVVFPVSTTKANAGSDKDICGGVTTTTLAANSPVSGNGTWSIIRGNGGSFTSITNPATAFTGVTGESYVLKWSFDEGLSCTSYDFVNVAFHQSSNPTLASAGADQSACSTSVTLAGNTPAIGTGSWSVISGLGGSFTSSTDAATTFTGNSNTNYILRWTTTNGDCPTTDDVAINILNLPGTANVGPDITTACGVNSTLIDGNGPGTGQTGVWTRISGTPAGTFTNANLANTTYTGTLGVTYVLRWTRTRTSSGCTSFDELSVTLSENPTVTSTTPASRCGSGTVNLIAATSAGSLNWYTAATGGSPVGTGTSFTTPIITVSTPYYVEASNNGCSSARTLVDATINDIPLVTSTTPASRCGSGTVNLIAATSAGSLNWYTAATGGSPVGTGTSFYNTNNYCLYSLLC
ncbi:MAG: hypothetical protein IPN99_03080 [Bacteroidetes bacterium]|nr:hypothetical protein [Bacteroidota bacterium]